MPTPSSHVLTHGIANGIAIPLPITITHLARLLKDAAALAVAKHDPLGAGIDQRIGARLASEGALGGMVAVLASDVDLGLHRGGNGGHVERRRGDDDICDGRGALDAAAKGGTTGGAPTDDVSHEASLSMVTSEAASAYQKEKKSSEY